MTIRFTCAECSSVLKIKDELAGSSARCPKCKTKFVVPAPTDERESSAEGEPPSSARQDNGKSHHRDSQFDAPSSSQHDTVKGQESSGDTAELNASFTESTDAKPQPPSKVKAPLESDTGEHDAHSNDAFHLSLDDDEPPAPAPRRATVVEAPPPPPVTVSAAPLPPAQVEAPMAAPANMTGSSDVDDLDCPSMFVSQFMTQSKPEAVEAAEPRRFNPTRISAEVASEFTAKSVPTPKPVQTRREEPIDPMKFLGNRDDDDDDLDDDFDKPIPVKSSRTFSPAPDSDADLSLSEDSDYEINSTPTPLPMTRRTPAAPASRPTPEKIDLATAAKMMKKAIKDSQADATRQREIEARPGFDYTLFFREFGLRGLAILLVAVVGPAILYFGFDYMLSSKLRLPKLGYVTGTVKLDGKPLSGVTVFFAPVEAAMEGAKRERARTSTGSTDASGNFKMMYAPGTQGVAAGKCRVWILINNAQVNFIPLEWMEASMRTTEVAVGSQKTPFDINLETKKK